jgi:hypothetical protein
MKKFMKKRDQSDYIVFPTKSNDFGKNETISIVEVA